MAKPTFTLKGTAKYARIFKPDNVSKKYQTSLTVERTDEVENLLETIKEVARENHPKEFKANKVSLNYEENEDGTVTLRLRNGYKPALVDSKNRPIKRDPKIGDGTTLKIRFTVEPGGFGDATKKRAVLLIPRSVMIVNLIPYTGGGFGDDEVEDGYEDDGSEDDTDTDNDPVEDDEPEEPAPKPRRKVDI